jgi:hypothetical protein
MKARPKVIRLVLGTALGELEVDIAASEAAVDLGVSVQAVVDATTLLLVKDDLEELAAVLLGAETLADNLNGVGEVGQDGVVDSGESAGAGTLLLLGVARAGRALGAGQNATRGEDQDVAVGELLLELTGEALLDASERATRRPRAPCASAPAPCAPTSRASSASSTARPAPPPPSRP